VLATANIAATGGWQTWTTVNATASLTAGVQTLRVHAATGGVNINWISFTANQSSVNLALNRPATASTTENASFPAPMAVDGNLGTRWASLAADPQWIYVDLGANYNVTRVKVTWETAMASSYQIQRATAAAGPWTTMRTVTGNATSVNDNTGLSGVGRYIRINGTARATQWGYSIWELEVYGTASARLATNEILETDEQESSAADKVRFYPNPADNLIYIEGVEDGTVISVITMTGSLSLQRQVKNKSIDVSPLLPGAYILNVPVGIGSVKKKLIRR
jgi:hypothetical protein